VCSGRCSKSVQNETSKLSPCPFCGGTGLETVVEWRSTLARGQQALALLHDIAAIIEAVRQDGPIDGRIGNIQRGCQELLRIGKGCST